MWKVLLHKKFLGYLAAVFVIVAATAALKAFGGHANPPTVALTFLLIILFLAVAWGSKPAILASILAVSCFNFFFLPPVGTFHIADPENWIALGVFLITAITTGQLSARAKLRADEANTARREVERLYGELQDSFEEASQAKALKQSERLKSALLDAVTHDLRTPLTSIKASVSTLIDDQNSDKKRETAQPLSSVARSDLLQVIDEEANRLDKFIEDSMAMARIEAGELQLRRKCGALDEILEAALKRASSVTADHRIDLVIDGELPSVRVDERAVAEVIYVLLENAAKYSPTGSVIRLTAQSGPGGLVRITVEDKGPGIPSELRDRVFDKFFRVMRNADRMGQKPGTGMGLAIAKGIVEAHDGQIWIEDAAGYIGTRVVILVPTGDVEDVNPVEEHTVGTSKVKRH